MVPAARKGDLFSCPTHGGGVIEGPCCFHVQIDGASAARAGDLGHCGSSGVLDTLAQGNPTVLIAGEPAAGMLHRTRHGGFQATGSATVFLGQPILDANGDVVPVPAACAFLMRGLADAPDNLGRHRAATSVRSTGERMWQFAGMETPIMAKTYEVLVRGRRVVVVIPRDLSQYGIDHAPTVAEIAAAVGALGDEQLDRLHEVIINPLPNPEDAHWAQTYETPGFYSGAVSGGRRTTVFPQGRAGQPSWDRLMQHEAAHFIWEERADVRAAWEAAMGKDLRSVNSYGANAFTEDFCEAVVMYALVKGTPCEATMKAAYPARFAVLEEVFKKGFPKKGTHAP